MPASQSRLLICLFASSLLSTTVLADGVIVTTTVDENNIDNQSCSLREAIAYINAKKAKKAIIDEEIAVISGSSLILSNNLAIAKQDLATEQAKTSPDATKVAQLNTTINELTQKINASIFALNRKLDETEDALTKEQNKEAPDTALIATYNATITQLKANIATKNEEKTVKETEMKDYRAKGLYGCSSIDDSSSEVITLLTLPTFYSLDAPITINFTATINGNAINKNDGTSFTLEENSLALPLRPIIKASGNHSLLIIDDGKANTQTTPAISVAFNNVDFMGCDQLCATNGGLILNKEALTIINSILSKGQANLGGAIYNDTNASLFIKESVIKENQSFTDGAAIYSALNNFALEDSLVTNNKANAVNTGVISVNSTASSLFNTFTLPHISNVTISSNEGIGVSAHGEILFNNNTIVNNTIGVRLNNNLPLIYNSIIAGNSQADCDLFTALPNDGKIYFTNNLSVQNKGCPAALAANNNIFISNTGNETLFAALDSNNRCAAPPALGLLCPLAEFGGLTKTHKPRLLAQYTKLSDSPIVNKGFFQVAGNLGLPCATTDQRTLPRENGENRCDIGAVEIQTGLQAYTQGDDIVFGQIKRFSPSENLGDAELLPAEYCSDVLGSGTYLKGCVRLVDPPKHGSVQFDSQTAEVVYSTNNPNFHGFDKFSYSIVTTLSRFSDANNDKILTTAVKVVSEPPASLESKTLDNGSINILSLLMLSGLLAAWRRSR